MIDWDTPHHRGRFHSEQTPAPDLSDDDVDASDFEATAPATLSAGRRSALSELHNHILEHWQQADVLFAAYDFDAPSAVTDVSAADVLATLWDIVANGDLPAPIAGCSLAWLMQQGVWPETLTQFLDGLFYALTDAGFSNDGLEEQQAIDCVRDYADALFEDAEPEEIWLFGLDPGFSCWFSGAGCDMAWFFIDLNESRCGLLLATDTD